MLKLIVVLLLAGTAADSSARDCIEKFAAEGSMISGKRFSTTVSFAQGAPELFLRRLARYLPSQGWSNVSVDSSLSILSAETGVAMGKGAKAPLTIVGSQVGQGTSLAFTFATTGMTAAKESSVRDGFCKMSEAAAREE